MPASAIVSTAPSAITDANPISIPPAQPSSLGTAVTSAINIPEVEASENEYKAAVQYLSNMSKHHLPSLVTVSMPDAGTQTSDTAKGTRSSDLARSEYPSCDDSSAAEQEDDAPQMFLLDPVILANAIETLGRALQSEDPLKSVNALLEPHFREANRRTKGRYGLALGLTDEKLQAHIDTVCDSAREACEALGNPTLKAALAEYIKSELQKIERFVKREEPEGSGEEEPWYKSLWSLTYLIWLVAYLATWLLVWAKCEQVTKLRRENKALRDEVGRAGIALQPLQGGSGRESLPAPR